ncbi:hypothetical protein D9Q98_009435 [Chlorella vulgaris]|uniref:Uncharacterized protein n=1 Tax=Chlorella vulgaris TaxID=3077 RepID=A0A9D4YSC7_CHLVU|nr:hypothetical protein D9Q98_009435 [Chlorella vulgaris]
MDDEPDLEVFSDDEELARDTTAVGLASGRDIQGIPWHLTQYTRESYRHSRNQQYNNYMNLEADVAAAKPAVAAAATKTRPAPMYGFYRSWRQVSTSIVHFQLRNLVWATSAHDVYHVRENKVQLWNSVAQRLTKVIDVSGGPGGGVAPGLGKIQLCTLCAKEGLVVGGGFSGEVVARRQGSQDEFSCSMRVTHSDNGITNAIEIYRPAAAQVRVVCSNNDDLVRAYDASTFQLVSQYRFPWAVNCTVAQPDGGRLLCTVGDHPTALLYDAASGRQVAELQGHADYSFAAAWHPDGNVLATGNQDMTTRLWDIRYPARSFALLQANISAIRSLRFSSDGAFLAAAEAADYVTLYDAASRYRRCQEIDLFGELAGVSFTPDGGRLFIAVSDTLYSSMLQFDRLQNQRRWRHSL